MCHQCWPHYCYWYAKCFCFKASYFTESHFPNCTLCSLIDTILTLLGVFGFATLLETSPTLLTIAKWGGFIFLGYYGFRSFKSVFYPHALEMDKKKVKPSIKKTVFLTLAFSLLNPHTYLDTVVLLGSVSSQFSDAEQPSFALGACFASFVWFFSLGYGARFLGPLFTKPKAWQVLDFIVGCMMWIIALAIVL
ncbi:MAG: LysE/ArgO family amino acid transporter [Candidatus Paracaedibacteraceae bacterium]|nr:LysE/ArgO family amino acid transporter [Candidatus Paracaedibacteraceae bacterium]